MAADSLCARRLRAEVGEILKSGFAGGSGQLFRLEKLAWVCHGELRGDEKAVCASVARFLDTLAKRQAGSAVTADEAAALCDIIRQPLIQCLDYLIGQDSGLTPAQMIASLSTLP